MQCRANGVDRLGLVGTGDRWRKLRATNFTSANRLLRCTKPSLISLRMNRRLYTCVALAVLGLATWIGYRALHPPLPSYKGRSLNTWFEKLPSTFPSGPQFSVPILIPTASGSIIRGERVEKQGLLYGSTNQTRDTLVAIKNIGTNGLPFLFMKFSRHESRGKKWLEKLAAWVGVRRPIFRDVGIERAQALSGLLALCPLPPEAIAEVTQLTNDPAIKTSVWERSSFWVSLRARSPCSFQPSGTSEASRSQPLLPPTGGLDAF